MSATTGAPRASIPAPARTPDRRLDRRLTAILAVSLAGLAALALALATSFGSSEPPPATGAAAVVPADALAYVHLSTDTTRPAVKRATRLAGRMPGLPLLAGAAENRLGAILSAPGAAGSFDFATDVRPWLGKEAAFALLDTPSTTAQTLIVLDVRDHARAAAFLRRTGATPAATYRDVTELSYRPGTVLAFVRHYLVIGPRAGVESAVDAAHGSGSSLQANPTYRRAASAEPADRVLDAYVSAAGVRRVLAPRSGLLGAAGALLDSSDLSGATVAVSALDGGARVSIHRVLDASLAQIAGTARQFEPTLASALPAGSSLLLDVRGLPGTAPRVLAATAAAGVAPRLAPLLHRLGTALASEGVNVSQALSLLAGETAVAVTPAAPAGRQPAHGPALVVVSRTEHPDQARGTLGDLEEPLAQLFPPPADGPGQAPVWNDVRVAGVSVRQLSIAPGLQLDYAVFKGLVVISTSLRAIGQIASHTSSLADQSSYQAALGNSPEKVTSLLFADFSQLLNLGEQMGLAPGARPSAVTADLEKIRAIGLASTRGEADTTAELFLQIP